jgi:hypothetical protein
VLGKVLLGAYATQENTWERFCKTTRCRTSARATGTAPARCPASMCRRARRVQERRHPRRREVRRSARSGWARCSRSRARRSSTTTWARSSTWRRSSARPRCARSRTQVYALIALNAGLGPTQSDAQPFFHANRVERQRDGFGDLVAGLDADRVVMRAQKDPNGQDFLDLSPAILLVPDSLRGTALQLNDAQYDPDASNKFQVPNMVRGLFREVIGTPRLTGDAPLLFADPLDWIVVAFLEGYGRGPVMESQHGWRIDGVEWKVTLYAKAQMGDPKGAVTNAGV